VTPDQALLWTDGRYFLQVRKREETKECKGEEGGLEATIKLINEST